MGFSGMEPAVYLQKEATPLVWWKGERCRLVLVCITQEVCGFLPMPEGSCITLCMVPTAGAHSKALEKGKKVFTEHLRSSLKVQPLES